MVSADRTALVLHGISATLILVANLTITVDSETLRRARVRAVQRGESVNAYLAEVLRHYAEDPDQQRVFAALATISAAGQAGRDGGARTWSREDLHRV